MFHVKPGATAAFAMAHNSWSGRANLGRREHKFDHSYLRAAAIELVPLLHFHLDGASTMLLDRTGPAGSDYDMLERIKAWEQVIAWAQARRYTEITAYVSGAGAAPAAGMTPAQAYESARAAIGPALTLAPGSAAWRHPQPSSALHSRPTPTTNHLRSEDPGTTGWRPLVPRAESPASTAFAAPHPSGDHASRPAGPAQDARARRAP